MTDVRRIKWLLECLTSEEDLNDWEQKFLESVEVQFEEKGTLSEKQVDALENMYEKRQ